METEAEKKYKKFEILDSAKEKYFKKGTSAFKYDPKKANEDLETTKNSLATDKATICNAISQHPTMTYSSQFPNLMPKSVLRGGKSRTNRRSNSRIRSKTKSRIRSKTRNKSKSRIRSKSKSSI